MDTKNRLLIAIEPGHNKTRIQTSRGVTEFPSEYAFAVAPNGVEVHNYQLSLQHRENTLLYGERDQKLYARTSPFRQVGAVRYGAEEWMNQVKVGIIAALKAYGRGPTPCTPIALVITIPITVFLNLDVRSAIKTQLLRIRKITDGNGKIWEIEIGDLFVLPESASAMLHQQKIKPRDPKTAYLTVDPGRGTTDFAEFLGITMVQGSGRSLMDQGLNTTFLSVYDQLASKYTGLTDAAVEKLFRGLAGKTKAVITIRPGIEEDVSSRYFMGLGDLFDQIIREIENNVGFDWQVMCLLGGGAYHLPFYFTSWVEEIGRELEIIDQAEYANLHGAFEYLRSKIGSRP
jgi:hypothetical protein